MAFLGRALTVAGFLTLCHAAFSASLFVKLVRASSSAGEGMSLPQDIVAEVGAAVALCLLGTLGSMGELKPVQRLASKHRKSIDDTLKRPEFALYNSRAVSLARRMRGERS